MVVVRPGVIDAVGVMTDVEVVRLVSIDEHVTTGWLMVVAHDVVGRGVVYDSLDLGLGD